MPGAAPPRAVIDTNVLFEGLTKQGGAAGLIIDAWRAGLLRVYVSNALAYEYADVLSRKLSEARWQRIKPVLGALLMQAEFAPSTTPGDRVPLTQAMTTSLTAR